MKEITEVKSNLRWPGGKSRMMKILDAFLPPDITKYLETFTGGGSVLLYILQKYHPEIAYANDIDSCLVNFYQTMKDNPEQLIDECLYYKDNYDEESFREVFKTLDKHQASGFFTANKCSFSGMNSNYSIQAYNHNFSVSSIKKIRKISSVIQNTNFLNTDFIKLDEVVPEKIEDFFIYLDPPYYGNRSKGLYGSKGKLHKDFDHEAMFEWVEAHKDTNKIMISYDDDPYIREIYQDWYQYGFDFIYTMTNTGGNGCKDGKELVICNYEVVNTPIFEKKEKYDCEKMEMSLW